MESADDTPEHHRKRSNFIRALVQHDHCAWKVHAEYRRATPRKVVQFWHDRDELPSDVEGCIESWRLLERRGFTHSLFDRHAAKTFIDQRLGERHATAFDACYHPAMQSDYFRLCYVLAEGGLYVDTDDVYTGIDIDHLFNDGRLKLQPLCYDITTELMVPPSVFAHPNNSSSNWIYYFNNNPLVSSADHPIIHRALAMATRRLELSVSGELPEIQSTTGPGNLTKSIFDLAVNATGIESSMLAMLDWESFAVTKWFLSYRNDSRNWRLSNRQRHQNSGQGAE